MEFRPCCMPQSEAEFPWGIPSLCPLTPASANPEGAHGNPSKSPPMTSLAKGPLSPHQTLCFQQHKYWNHSAGKSIDIWTDSVLKTRYVHGDRCSSRAPASPHKYEWLSTPPNIRGDLSYLEVTEKGTKPKQRKHPWVRWATDSEGQTGPGSHSWPHSLTQAGYQHLGYPNGLSPSTRVSCLIDGPPSTPTQALFSPCFVLRL